MDNLYIHESAIGELLGGLNLDGRTTILVVSEQAPKEIGGHHYQMEIVDPAVALAQWIAWGENCNDYKNEIERVGGMVLMYEDNAEPSRIEFYGVAEFLDFAERR